jgi:hypothetical protein
MREEFIKYPYHPSVLKPYYNLKNNWRHFQGYKINHPFRKRILIDMIPNYRCIEDDNGTYHNLYGCKADKL